MHPLHQVACMIALQSVQGRWLHDQDAALVRQCTAPSAVLVPFQAVP
jgi:hypothetical protein